MLPGMSPGKPQPGWRVRMSVESSEASDEELLLANARTGDSDFMEVLYRRHWDAGLAFARRILNNDFDAEDITSDAFMKVFSAISRGNGPQGPFRPYLFRTVRSCAADHWSAQARQNLTAEVEATGQEDPGYDEILEVSDRSLAASAFAKLPVRWQTVLWHLDVEGEPPRRVAPILGLEPNAVSAVAIRARRGLRQAYLEGYVSKSLGPECQPTLPLLSKSVNGGKLSSREQSRLDDHADDCLKCTMALKDLQDVKSTMRRAIVPWFLGAPYVIAATGTAPARNLSDWFGRLGAKFPRGATQWILVTGVTVAVAATGAGLMTMSNKGPAPMTPGLSPGAVATHEAQASDTPYPAVTSPSDLHERAPESEVPAKSQQVSPEFAASSPRPALQGITPPILDRIGPLLNEVTTITAPLLPTTVSSEPAATRTQQATPTATQTPGPATSPAPSPSATPKPTSTPTPIVYPSPSPTSCQVVIDLVYFCLLP
jgi:RNA polymerase sigma factor (sigma-70 family)